GLGRADQGRLRHALLPAHEVETPMDAVRAVDVGVARRSEHRCVAWGPAAVAVARGIFLVVRLDLDDAAADAVDEQRDADEIRRHLVDAPGEEATSQHATVRRSGRAPETPAPAARTRRRTRYRPKRSRSAGSSRTRARPPRGSRSTELPQPA